MTASSSRRWRGVAGVALAALAWPALAQVGAPLQLMPPPSATVPDDGALSEEIAPPPPPITVAPLDAPKADSVALVDERSGGFPDTLWQDTTGDVAHALILQLPHRYVNFAARRVAQRFLLSAAVPAAGDGGSADAKGALLEARVTALGGMGDWADAIALADLVPADQRTPGMAHVRADGLLIMHKTDVACGDARRGIDDGADDPYWQKVTVLCQSIDGQAAAAGLGLGLLREQGIEDPAFFWAADLLQGDTGSAPKNVKLTPLTLAMLRQAAKPLPADLVAGGDPTMLTVAAQLAGGGPADEARLALLERAVAASVVAPDVLRTAYAALSIKDEPADSGHIALDTPRHRAATYQLAAAQTVPTARAEVIARAIDLARNPEGDARGLATSTVGLIFADMVLQMPPSADLAWFAGTAVRVLIAADNAGVATAPSRLRNWLDLVHGMSATSAEVGIVNNKLWPYRQLLTGAPIASDAIHSWADSLKDLPPAQSRAQQEFMLGLLTSVGEQVDLADWQSLLENGDDAAPTMIAAPAAAWHALSVATTEKRLGEGVALALQLTGFIGANPPGDLAVSKAIESLAALDRGADARAIAAELALDHGL